jgi:hypothetical protein
VFMKIFREKDKKKKEKNGLVVTCGCGDDD